MELVSCASMWEWKTNKTWSNGLYYKIFFVFYIVNNVPLNSQLSKHKSGIVLYTNRYFTCTLKGSLYTNMYFLILRDASIVKSEALLLIALSSGIKEGCSPAGKTSFFFLSFIVGIHRFQRHGRGNWVWIQQAALSWRVSVGRRMAPDSGPWALGCGPYLYLGNGLSRTG